MDFGIVELDDEHRALLDEIRAFIDEHVTEEVHEHDWTTRGDGYHPGLHLALGERGWIMPHWPVEDGGAGMDRLGQFLLAKELQRANAPGAQLGTVRLIVTAIQAFGQDAIRDDILRGVARGEIRLALGYTEPHGGSDIASARTRAVRDGDEWVITGAKMFTTGAHFADYAFLITRTDKDAPKHKGMTMFLMPLRSPGVEIRPVYTYGNERTNMVFFDDVRVPDVYRLGEVNDGWRVLRAPLDAEHGLSGGPDDGLDSIGVGLNSLFEAHDAIETALNWADTPGPDGRIPAEDGAVLDELARAVVLAEAAFATEGASGRILGAENAMRIAEDLLALFGLEALVEREVTDPLGLRVADELYRHTQVSVTYGGTVEVFRGIIAQHELGLPRPEFPLARVFSTASVAQRPS